MKNNGLFAVIVALNGDTPPPPPYNSQAGSKIFG